MLDVSPKNLREEVESAVSLRKKHTDVSARLIKRYAGANYREDWEGDESGNNHDAHEFEYQVNMVPSLIHTNPAVEVKGLLPGIDDEVKMALDAAYPQWIEAVNFAEKMQPVAYDVGFDYGVVMTGLEVLPGYDSQPEPKPLWPMVWRVSPRRFFMDPQASSFESARYMGHSWCQDKQDLLDAIGPDGEPVFDKEAVMELTEDADLDAARSSVQTDDKGRVARKQVVGYEVWVRETNTVFTIGTSKGGSDEKYLRAPRLYSGCPTTGPYTLFGAYLVPDQLYPLPMLAVTAGLVEEINRHRAQASDDAGAAKRLVMVDSQAKQASNAITMAKSGTVVRVQGLASGTVKDIEIGGPCKENIEYIQYLQDLLDRQSGLTEIIRGNITGATATETDLAQQSADVRARYARGRFREGVRAVFKSVGHFLIHNDQITFMVMSEDPATGQKVPKQFVGGMLDGQDPNAYQRLNVTIQPYSMEMVDQGLLQRRMQLAMQTTEASLPLMMQYPFWKAREQFNDFYESLNIKGGGDKYFDWAILAQMQTAAVMQQQMAVAQEQQGMAQGQEAHNKAMSEPPKESKGPKKGVAGR